MPKREVSYCWNPSLGIVLSESMVRNRIDGFRSWESSESMVSVLDSGLSGLGSSPGWGDYVRYFILTLPLSTKISKWLPANLMLGVTLRPIKGSWERGRGINIPRRFMLQKLG